MAADPTAACRWEIGDDLVGMWDTACGNGFVFENGGPRENKFGFCPYCGKPLVVSCHLCKAGFPLNSRGQHYGTQALGMIENTPCLEGKPRTRTASTGQPA